MTLPNKQTHFLKLYEPVQNSFEKYCLTIAGNRNDARELVSETIIRAYEQLEQLRDDQAFLFYLFKIAKRLMFKSRKKPATEDYQNVVVRADIDLDLNLDIKILHQALKRLPQKLKNAVIMYEISGLTMKEIAEVEKCTVAAVKVRVMRGRNKLKEMLTEPTSDLATQVNHAGI